MYVARRALVTPRRVPWRVLLLVAIGLVLVAAISTLVYANLISQAATDPGRPTAPQSVLSSSLSGVG